MFTSALDHIFKYLFVQLKALLPMKKILSKYLFSSSRSLSLYYPISVK